MASTGADGARCWRAKPFHLTHCATLAAFVCRHNGQPAQLLVSYQLLWDAYASHHMLSAQGARSWPPFAQALAHSSRSHFGRGLRPEARPTTGAWSSRSLWQDGGSRTSARQAGGNSLHSHRRPQTAWNQWWNRALWPASRHMWRGTRRPWEPNTIAFNNLDSWPRKR
jgi:hypothetical protein